MPKATRHHRAPRRGDNSPWPLVIAMVVASVGVHLLLWPLGNQFLDLGWDPPPHVPAPDVMEVSLVPTEGETLLPGQLVQPDRVEDERKPEETERISEFDSRVEKETRAPSRKKAPEYDPRVVREKSGVSGSGAEAASEEVTPPIPLPIGPDKPGEASEPGALDTPTQVPLGARGEQGASVGASALPPRKGLHSNSEAFRKTFGGSGSIDNLEGVDEGAENILNTERFRFSSFFNRMRNQIAQHWDPNEVMHRIDPERRTYGERTRKTLVHIRLTPSGEVKKIDIMSDSGVRELDKEAIEAIHLAAPFVNPPPQMVDERTGFIEIDFMFVLQNNKTAIHRYLR